MHKTIVGMADSYGTAERIVEDLELAGIVGSEVQVIANPDDKVTGFEDTSGSDRREGFTERIRNFFGSHSRDKTKQASDNYVEDPDFYITKVREGRSMVIVRMPDVPEVGRAVEILRGYGAVDPRGGDQPRVFSENDRPESTQPDNAGKKQQTMGDDTLTTGGTRADLEGRGTKIRSA